MARLWGGVLVVVMAVGCSPARPRGCYQGCLPGTVCDQPTQYCVAGQPDSGVVMPDAGLDAGQDAGLTADAGPVTCSTTGCPAWSECLAEVCLDRYTGINVTAPLRAGGSFGVSASLNLRTGASPNPPSTLEVSAQVGTLPGVRITLTPDAGAWVGTIPATMEGAWVSTVTWPGTQLSGTATTVVDFTAPRFEVTIAPAPVRRVEDGGVNERDPADPAGVTSWRRDETGDIMVRALDSDVVPATVQIHVGDLVLAHDGGCLAAGCSFSVDYSVPTFRAWRGGLRVRIQASDDLGNTATVDGGAVPLTRLYWRRDDPGIVGSQAVGAVALDPNGTVYFARGVYPDGQIVVLEPTGDLQGIRYVTHRPTTVPMLGLGDAGVVYFGAGDQAFGLALLRSDSGGVTLTPFHQGPAGLSPMLIVQGALVPESAIWNQGGVIHALGGTWPDNTPLLREHFQVTARNRRVVAVSPTGYVGLWSEGMPSIQQQQLGALSNPGEPAMGWEITDGAFVGVTGTSTTRGFWISNGTSVIEYPTDAGPGPVLPFAFRQGEAWYTSVHSLCHGVPGATPTCLTLPGNGGFGISAVLTAGQKVILPATRNGTDLLLMQVDGTTLTVDWEVPLAQPGVPAELMHVRCLRGTLGVGVGVSLQGELISAIIDQPGIDATADWAQFSHDPRNTFNFSTPLAPYRCP